MSEPLREPKSGASPFEEGQIIAGKYEAGRVLGQGGMGVVVAAHHAGLRQNVAIKLLLPEALQMPGAVQRFLREARSAVAIQSEHVARVLDVGTLESGEPYMVMEHLTGQDLRAVLKSRGALPITEAVDYVLQACEAIAQAHALGIIHRDLKPSNVFLTRRPDGSALVKVLDFGLSKTIEPNPAEPSTSSLTGTNMMAGSPHYMSPEQLRSLKTVDHRTDIWALGAILYELCTARKPFEAETALAVFAQVAADPPTSPRSLRPDLPHELERTILQCLQKDLSRRVQDVAELAAKLAPFAPPETRGLAERIARIAGGSRHLSTPPLPAAAPAPSQPGISALGDDLPTAPRPGRTPPREALLPVVHAALALDATKAAMPMHVARVAPSIERRRAAEAREIEPRVGLGDLGLGPPIRVLLFALLLTAADMLFARTQGEPFFIGPVRPLWAAAPIAAAGAVWLLVRLASRPS